MTASGVIVSRVSKRYRDGTEALNDVSLDIGSGLFGLLGPNGAGKTTLLRIMSTLLAPTSGDVSIDGIDAVSQREQVRASLGYLPQEFGLYPRLSTVEHLRYFCDLKGLRGKAADAEIDRVVSAVGLAPVASKSAASLSGGMRQRVGVGIALIGSPRLLIVDEPTVGLDPEERTRFRTMLVDIAHTSVVVLSTHIVQDIEAGCASAAILAGGTLRAVGPPQRIAALAEGRVWTVTTDRRGADEIRSRSLIVDMRAAGDEQVELRIAGDCDVPGAVSVPARLEDAYLLVLHESPVAAR